MSSRTIALVLALGGAVTALSAQPAQRVHRAAFEPASDAAFAVARQFYDLDPALPLAARTVETWEQDDARYEVVVYTTHGGERVPATLALPGTGDGPFPCALLLHGLGGSRDRWWRDDRRGLVERLLAAGVAVFALDLRHHGQRAATNDYQPPAYLTLGNELFTESRDMVIRSAIDARRALAYLAERPEVDAARVGVVGYSMGAMIGVTLGALEPRLRAVVACAIPTTEQPLPIDPFEFAPRVSVPTRLIVGRSDWLSSPADAARLRDLLQTRDRDLVLLDAGHSLPPAFTDHAAAWLLAHL